MSVYRNPVRKNHLLLLASLFLCLLAFQSPLRADGNIQIDLTDETVENQAATARMTLEAFSGTVESIGDSTVSVDSFTFTFNEGSGYSSPQDSVDTIVLSYRGNRRDSVTVDGTSPYTLDLGETLPGNSAPEDFSANLIMERGPEHDAQFDFNLRNVQYTEVSSGNVLNESEPFGGSPTNRITIKALVETYDDVDGENLPGVLASESGDIPLLHMEFAGQNSSQNPVLGFSNVEFLLQEMAGNIVPGSLSDDDDYGDFSNLKLIRSDQEEFGAGNQETLVTLGTLPSYAASLYPMELGGLMADDEDYFTETTDRSHYFVTISTNQGWGEEPDGDPRTQYFGYGDAWNAFTDTGDIAIQYGSDNSDTLSQAAFGPGFMQIAPSYGGGLPSVFYHSVFPPLRFVNPESDRYFGQPTIQQNDGLGLDFFPDAFFGIAALGASDTGSINTKLQEITLTFPSTSKDFTPRTDLRDLTETKFSGLAIWHNASNFESQGHGEDKLLKISPPDDGPGPSSSWVSDTKVRLRLQNGFELPSPSEAIGSIDEELEKNRGMVPGSVNPTIYITALFDRTGNFPDTFVAEIPPRGLQFTDGTSVAPPGGIRFLSSLRAQPVSTFFEQFPDESGDNPIGAPSGPQPVIGLNTLDYADSNNGGTEALVDRVDVVFENDGDSFTATDLNPLANTDTSGVSLWRDNSSDPQNKQGIFQPDVDKRIPLKLHSTGDCQVSGKLYSCKGAPRGDYQQGFRVLLRVDHGASPSASVPADDADTSAGSDFFLVVNTSAQADNQDSFRATLGNPRIEDGSNPQIQFVEESDTSSELASIFASGDNSATNRFFSQEFVVNTITAQQINSLLSPPAKISASGEPRGLLGINVSDGPDGDQTLEQVRVTFEDVTNFDTTDLRALSSDKTSGVALYRDDGDGVFSAENDSVIPLTNPKWESFSGTSAVNLTPSETVEVPDSNEVGNELDDFFVVVRGSSTLELGDQFRASIRGGDIQFNIEDSGEDVSETTPIITASLPILVNKRTESPYENIQNPGDRIDVIGVNAADQGNDEYLESVRINFDDVNQSDFQKTDLMDLTSDTGSGVALYRDTNQNGTFEPEEDLFLQPDNPPSFDNNNNVLLDFENNSTQDTSIPENLDDHDDFFVVLRASESMQHGDDFVAEIPSGGVETTNYSSGAGDRTDPIVRGSANINSVTFSDTDLMNDQVSATVQANNQDTVEIRLAQDDDVHDLPPSQFERVEVREPDQPGGNQYSFNDLSVRVSSDTIGLVARGFNDTGPTDFSEREILRRRELAGIRLEGRNNVDLANALAADEDFGVVVFGQKGGSNTNTSDPAFDPSNNETLKVIPPQGESATMRVFNLNQQMVYKRSGLPGEPVEWQGQGLGVDVVNNGAYVVKVKSGSEEKSFPVMVVK